MPRAAGILAAVVMAAGAAGAQTVGAGSPLDRVVEAARGQGLAGEVLASSGDRTVYARAVPAPGRPHRAGERWRWASVSKQVTALLVMQEVAAGRLSLDDTLAARLPAFRGPTAGRGTLRMLLQHTSGLPDPDDTPADASSVPAFYVALGAWGFSATLKGCAASVKLVERRGEIGGVEVRNLLAPELKRALVVFADRAGLPFGEVWQGRDLTYELASAAFCAG